MLRLSRRFFSFKTPDPYSLQGGILKNVKGFALSEKTLPELSSRFAQKGKDEDELDPTYYPYNSVRHFNSCRVLSSCILNDFIQLLVMPLDNDLKDQGPTSVEIRQTLWYMQLFDSGCGVEFDDSDRKDKSTLKDELFKWYKESGFRFISLGAGSWCYWDREQSNVSYRTLETRFPYYQDNKVRPFIYGMSNAGISQIGVKVSKSDHEYVFNAEGEKKRYDIALPNDPCFRGLHGYVKIFSFCSAPKVSAINPLPVVSAVDPPVYYFSRNDKKIAVRVRDSAFFHNGIFDFAALTEEVRDAQLRAIEDNTLECAISGFTEDFLDENINDEIRPLTTEEYKKHLDDSIICDDYED